MTDLVKEKLKNVVEGYLEDYHFDDLLEELQIDPVEAFECLFNNGLVDELVFESFITAE